MRPAHGRQTGTATFALLVGVAMLATACAGTPETGAAAEDPWEADIRAFEAADREEAPGRGGVVFVGSSSIRMWDTLTRDFPEAGVINRDGSGEKLGAAFADDDVLLMHDHASRRVFDAGLDRQHHAWFEDRSVARHMGWRLSQLHPEPVAEPVTTPTRRVPRVPRRSKRAGCRTHCLPGRPGSSSAPRSRRARAGAGRSGVTRTRRRA